MTRRPLTTCYFAARYAMTIVLVGTISSSGRGDDWPAWRGGVRCGVSSEANLPVKWSETENVLWKTPLAGSGISSPIIWKDRVFVTTSDGPALSTLHVICLSRETGDVLWARKFWGTAPTLYHGEKSSMASPSPVTDGAHVFAFFGTGDVFCLDFEGGLVWQRSLAEEYGAFENRFAASSSPVVYDDTVILQCDHYGASYVIAIDKRTGENRWKIDRPECWLSWSSPLVLSDPSLSRDELILSGSHKVDALDPRTGDKLWTVGGMERECIPTPVFGNGHIYAVSGPKGPTLAIRPGGSGDVTKSHVDWSNNRGAPYVPSAILVGELYYLVDDQGIGTCLDANTGERVWQKRLPGNYPASPVAGAGGVYFTNEAGETTVLDAGKKKFTERSHNSIGEPVFATPAIADGRFYLRTVRHLYCIGDASKLTAGVGL